MKSAALVHDRGTSIVAVCSDRYWADSSPIAQAIDLLPAARHTSARETANPAKQIMPTITIATSVFSDPIAVTY